MPNQNIIDRISGAGSPAQGSKVVPAFLPGTTTTAMVVTNQLGNAATIGTNPAWAASPGGYGLNLDGYAFKIRLAGTVTTTGNTNITAAIMVQNNPVSTTYTSGNVIATNAATALNTAKSSFLVEAECIWDSNTGKIYGFQYGWNVAGTMTTVAAITNSVAVTAENLLIFSPVVTSSGASTATFYINDFVLEAV